MSLHATVTIVFVKGCNHDQGRGARGFGGEEKKDSEAAAVYQIKIDGAHAETGRVCAYKREEYYYGEEVDLCIASVLDQCIALGAISAYIYSSHYSNIDALREKIQSIRQASNDSEDWYWFGPLDDVSKERMKFYNSLCNLNIKKVDYLQTSKIGDFLKKRVEEYQTDITERKKK